MKVYEILSFNAEMLKRLHKNGIRTTDYKSLEIYNEYLKLIGKGYKVVYAVAYISNKYKVCNRKVYKIISKMEKDCQISAVE